MEVSMVRFAVYSLVLFLVMPAALSAEWNLVFEDDFQRATVGDLYTTEREAQLSIVEGQLLFVGAGATAMINRPFAMDVRLEFDSMAWPDMPPCDLSVRMSSAYLLGFGARSNSANQPGNGPNLYHPNSARPTTSIRPVTLNLDCHIEERINSTAGRQRPKPSTNCVISLPLMRDPQIAPLMTSNLFN